MSTTTATSPRQGRPTRIQGIDIARALAILGMVMVHFGPFQPDTSDAVGWIYRTSHGRASILFVLLAGIGVSLLFGGGRTGTTGKDPGRAWSKIWWRAVVFLPAGVALQQLDTPVAVILQYYAAYYVVGALANMLSTRWLLVVTAVWAVLGPVIYVTFFDTSLAGRGAAATFTEPFAILSDILVTGYYPVITWAVPVLVGVLVGRTDVSHRGTQWALAGAGVVTAAAAYGASELARGWSQAAGESPYLLAEGHSGAPLNVAGATGVAVAILGLSLVAGATFPRLTWPLAAVGRMALTVYVGHLIVLDLAPQWLEARDAVESAIGHVMRFFVVTVGICSLWLARFRRGPLEWLLALPFQQSRARSQPMGQSSSWSPPPPPPPSPPAPSGPSSRDARRPSSPPTPTSTSSSGMPPPRP